MNNAKTVDELIKVKNLTEEELELFADLIRESRERELKTAELSQQTKANLHRLSDGLTAIVNRTTDLSRAMENLLDEMETLYIRSMPDSRFIHE